MFRLQQPRRAHANELKSILESHFVEAGHILVFLDIIEQPANSKRAWCIFESFSKIHHALLDRAAVAHDHHPYRIMVIGNSKLSGEFLQRNGDWRATESCEQLGRARCNRFFEGRRRFDQATYPQHNQLR